MTAPRHTPPRSFRIPEDIYVRALHKAQSENRSLTSVVVAGLEEYIEDYEDDDPETTEAPHAQ
ncbi:MULTISPECIES: hypothetical protein [Microbacterium]|uniref:hypothetical protein n=1 Tax=Microbacterium TaxID=33882 RepID=UPI001D17076C|nr:hypothetical protein [Microbacterium testaceum]MCC4250514.1 hypothetical protein [Microbacterium testaceum]